MTMIIAAVCGAVCALVGVCVGIISARGHSHNERDDIKQEQIPNVLNDDARERKLAKQWAELLSYGIAASGDEEDERDAD